MAPQLGRRGDRVDSRGGFARRVASGVYPVAHLLAVGRVARHDGRNAGAGRRRAGAILSKVRRALTAITVFLIATAAVAAQQQFLSKVYTIDRIYRSMEGPYSIQTIYL